MPPDISIAWPGSVRLHASGAAPADPVSQTLPTLLLVCFLLYTFVGTSPLAETGVEARADGSPLDRVALVSLAGMALVVILMRFRTASRLAGQMAPVWLMLAWCMSSLLWSDFSELTLRRTVSVILVATMCLGIAAGFTSFRRLHSILFGVLALVIVANLVTTILRPDFAVTPIGVRGFYTQKNQAGLVAMLSVITALGWTWMQSRWPAVLAGLAIVGLSGCLLYVSESKTSLILAGAACAAAPLLLLLRRLGGVFCALLIGLSLPIAGCLTLIVMGFGSPTFVSIDTDPTFTGRDEIWTFVESEIARRPWTGSGYGAFWDVGPDQDPLARAPPGTWLSQVQTGIINQAHNGYLDLLVQVGIPALVLGLLTTMRATWQIVLRFFSDAAAQAERVSAMTFLLIMLVFIVHNLTESSLWARGQMFANLSLLIAFMATRLVTASAAELTSHDEPQPADRHPSLAAYDGVGTPVPLLRSL